MAVSDVWMINPVSLDSLAGEAFEVWVHSAEREVIGTL